MKYFSTRKGVKEIGFQDVVMAGLAEDGGLYLPSDFPQIDVDGLRGKSYTDMAFEIIKHFADDIGEDDLRSLINKSYSTFSTPEVTPVVNIGECYVAELFHGPTYAFKDVALQLLGNLFEYILLKSGDKLNIIGATSGDTGSAAIHGVRGKKNINIAILYPDARVSQVQELQMTSVLDKNVHTLAVKGTFDDCQNMVKGFFADTDFKRKYRLGAVNSINWARIMAQIVYYFYSYTKLPSKGAVNFVVPTGNFGNIFAGYCAARMGLEVDKLVLATNENDILHRFISKGDYSPAAARLTHSPSMDIQLASNFERYLYYLYAEDAQLVKRAMSELRNTGKITFNNDELSEVKKLFSSYAASNQETEEAIKRVYDSCGYIIDPHTACAVQAAYKLGLSSENTVVLSTALPAKFGDVVRDALGVDVYEPEGIKALRGAAVKKEVIANDSHAVKKRLTEFFAE